MTLKINYQYAHAKLDELITTNEFGFSMDAGEVGEILRSATLLEDFTYTTKIKDNQHFNEAIVPVLILVDDDNIKYEHIKIPAGSTIWFLKSKYYDMHNEEILVKFEDILYWKEV